MVNDAMRFLSFFFKIAVELCFVCSELTAS